MKKLVDALFRNKWLKLLSVALAIAMWVYVSKRTYRTKEFKVPIEFVVPPGHFILVKPWDEADVELHGPATVMNQLRDGSLRIRVDVLQKRGSRLPETWEHPRSVPVSIEPSDIRNLPINIVVRRIHPPRATITVDRIVEKRLAVEIDRKEDLIGKVKDGFRIHQIYLAPRPVLVRGPKSILAQIDAIRPVPVPVEGLDRLWETKRRLRTRVRVERGGIVVKGPDKMRGRELDCLSPNPAEVTVRIEVIPVDEKRTVENVPIEVRGRPGLLYTVFNKEMTQALTAIPKVDIRGPKAKLEKPELHAFLDLVAVGSPTEQPDVPAKVQFTAAAGVEVVTGPVEVVVKIRPQKPE